MKLLPPIGSVAIGLALWGLITFDLFIVAASIAIFLGSFLFDFFYKKRNIWRDNRLSDGYHNLTVLIHTIQRDLRSRSEIDRCSQKAILTQALFFLGMIHAASNSLKMNDNQFLDLFIAIFNDLHFNEDFRLKVLSFYNSLSTSTNHNAFPAVLGGNALYTKFVNDNVDILTAGITGRRLIENFVQDPKFPASIGEI